jgi:predicted RNA binding protein YcfA (HicA-like mRNA interferase family)
LLYKRAGGAEVVSDVVLYEVPDRERLRQRISQRPNAVRFAELVRLLEAYGWTLRRIRGSHHVFVRGGAQVVVPFRRPTVLLPYVYEVLKATAGEAGEGTDGESERDADG